MTSSGTATSHTEFLVSRGAILDAPGEIACHFGGPTNELSAFSESAALIDRTASISLMHEGVDALDLLHRLSTNDLITLEPGDARFTVLTSERGRMIDVLHVAVLEKDRLLLLSESPNAQSAVDWIEKFTIIEDAAVRDVSSEMARFAVIGPKAIEMAKAGFGIDLAHGQASGSTDISDNTILIASKWADTDRVDVVTPRASLGTVWDRLTTVGAVPAGDIAFQAARIDAGVPLAGNEITEKANPLELGLKDLISFSKGCYVGQEVVARLDTYDKLQQHLVSFESASALVPGTSLSSGGKRAGAITSVSPLPDNGHTKALGFARRGFWSDGTVLEFEGGTVTARELGEESAFS